MARPHKPLFVRPLRRGERKKLERIAKRASDARLVNRARMVLLSNQRKKLSELGTLLDTAPTAVANWIRRYESEGIDGLYDQPRSGRPRKADDAYAERLIDLPFVSCFHSLQAVAKAIKAILVLHQIEFSRSHDIGTLLRQLEATGAAPPQDVADELAALTRFSVGTRYPLRMLPPRRCGKPWPSPSRSSTSCFFFDRFLTHAANSQSLSAARRGRYGGLTLQNLWHRA